MEGQNFINHLWDKGHVLLVHFPIALLSLAFLFSIIGCMGKLVQKWNIEFVEKLNLERAFDLVLPLHMLGSLFIYPTMLFGERDAGKIEFISEEADRVLGRHEQFGDYATTFYLISAFALFHSVMVWKQNNGLLKSKSRLGAIYKKRESILEANRFAKMVYKIEGKLFDLKSYPTRTFAWLIISAVGFGLLLYTGYLGGQLVHEHGVLAR